MEYRRLQFWHVYICGALALLGRCSIIWKLFSSAKNARNVSALEHRDHSALYYF